MSESKRDRGSYGYARYGYTTTEVDELPPTLKTKLKEASRPFIRMAKAIDRAIPNVRTVDGMAYELAKRTPRALAICMALLFAGIVASRLNLWVEGFLWGIPSLGAISMGAGFWVWSSNVMLRPDLSPEARAVLQRAIRLQLLMVFAGILAVIYFVGMALRFW